MKRERSPSVASHPCFKDGRVDVCRSAHRSAASHEEYVMVHKRLRGLNASSFSRSSMARIGNNSIDCCSSGSACKPTSLATSSSPSSVEDQPTQTQYADFSVDRSAVSPSEAVSLAAEMAADFYSEVSIMYDMLSDINTPSEEGLAVGELMRRMRNLLSDGSHSGGNAVARITNVRGVYNGLIRVYVFLFQRYYRAFVVLDVNELLIACWQRLLAFVVEYRILDEVFIHKVSEHVVKIVTAC